jgi:hypothetical protein
VPADERSLSDRTGKGLEGEGLGAIPEGRGRGEEVLLGLVARLVVEKCVEPRDRGDPLVIERLVCLCLGCRGVLFQIFEPCEKDEKE